MADPLAILLASPGHGAAHAAFTLAAGASALGRPVFVFTMGAGCRALLAEPDMAEADSLVRSRGVAGLAELRDAALELGARFVACEAGLRAEAIAPDRLMKGAEIAGVITFLDASQDSAIVSL